MNNPGTAGLSYWSSLQRAVSGRTDHKLQKTELSEGIYTTRPLDCSAEMQTIQPRKTDGGHDGYPSLSTWLDSESPGMSGQD